ncbi:MAG: hypothetical protein OK457_00565 [Thaumarchaeota archaeon]|nr:hypothetical protein [Nitrososphaerota archaeon]
MNDQPTADYLFWDSEGMHCWTTTPAHKIKLLAWYGQKYGLKTLVETGTAEGDTLFALQNDFDELYSAEVNPEFYGRAAKRFEGSRNVHVFLEDSIRFLNRMLSFLPQPMLFWLDAHWDNKSPLQQELETIFNTQKSGVILIDDLQGFWHNDWPEVAARTVDVHPGWNRETIDGIMRVVKEQS